MLKQLQRAALPLAVVVGLGAAAAIAAAGPDSISADLTPIQKDLFQKKVPYYYPQRLALTPNRPANVTKEPAYTGKPQYGVLHFGGESNNVAIALDEAADATSAKLYVDSNGDGDLTNDPPVTWKRETQKATNRETGKEVEMVLFQGTASVMPPGAKAEPYPISIYRFAPETARLRGIPTDILLYYRQYGREGKLNLGGKTYPIVLLDEQAAGRYDQPAHADKQPPHVSLLIDRNDDGRFDPRFEKFDLAQPFNIGGTTYEVDKIATDGSKLALKISDKQVAETPIPADLGVGKPALAFTRDALGGKTISFPADYKGKLVMLDFWATWCGPCREEIPGLVKAYNKYHDKGFEVLGISLDQANQAEKVQAFTKENGMTWPQVYDGKYWSADIAKLYGVESIPQAYLVDGTSGKTVAAGDSLRGELLDSTLSKALAAQKQASAK